MKNMNKIMMILVAMLAITTAMIPAWGQTATEFGYCYDVSRSPVWPKTIKPTRFSGFGNPLVANDLTSVGPWKLEFYENYNASHISTYGFDASTVSDLLSAYNVTTVPVYKLYRKVNDNDQFVSYVVLCAYSSVNNANGHTAFLSKPVAGYYGGIGCLLSGNQYNSGDQLNITVDGDMNSGFPSEITTTNYTLTLSSNNTQYGTVSAEGTGVVPNNNGTYTVPAGTQVTVTANPNPGSHFVNWDGDQNLTNPTRQITVSSNQTITANFDYKIYNVPDGWTVKANNESVNVTNGTTDGIQDGKTVKITPAPGQKILTVKMKKKTN